MKNHLKAVLVFFTILIVSPSCTKDDEIIILDNNFGTLVLVSDYDENSDVMIRLKGKLINSFPGLEIEYIHSKAFNIKEAAYLLETAALEYPENTWFTAIVEPGMNTERMVFSVDGNKKFLVPDNGLATYIIEHMNTEVFYKVENLFDDTDEHDFVDFYAEASIKIIEGNTLSSFGSVIDSPQKFDYQEAVNDDGRIFGQVLFTDNFGNCITNIPEELLQDMELGSLLSVTSGDIHFFTSLFNAYSDVPLNENVCLSNNSRRLELAVNMGNLSERYGLMAGDVVEIMIDELNIGLLHYNDFSLGWEERLKGKISDLGITDDGVSYHSSNAGGDVNAFSELIPGLVSEEIDVLIAFSTPAAQAAANLLPEDIPLVFTVVTDPVSAGLFELRSNICGLSDAINLSQILDFSLEVLPEYATAGRIYNSTEANSVYAQQELEMLAPLKGISLFGEAVNSHEDIPQAYEALKQNNIQYLITTADNTISLHLSDLLGLAMPDMIPLIGTDIENTRDGAVASLSVDYELIAAETGRLALAVCRGIVPDQQETLYFNTDIISVNTQSATELQIDIPQSIIDKADYIFP